jgi:hypothetical protein
MPHFCARLERLLLSRPAASSPCPTFSGDTILISFSGDTTFSGDTILISPPGFVSAGPAWASGPGAAALTSVEEASPAE